MIVRPQDCRSKNGTTFTAFLFDLASAPAAVVVDVRAAMHPSGLQQNARRRLAVQMAILLKRASYRKGASFAVDSAPHKGVTEALATDKAALARHSPAFQLSGNASHSERCGPGVRLTFSQTKVWPPYGVIAGSSGGPGKGSDLIVRLPVSESEPHQQNVDHRPLEHAAARRVVVIDDDRDVADSLAMLLELLGCDVRTAYCGEAGIPLVVEFRPSIIFLDLGMPDMNGYETARHIRAEPAGQQAQLVALTGWGQAADKARTREAGFDRHLVKPADIDALEELIASADAGPQG